jgi:hypothetical protein
MDPSTDTHSLSFFCLSTALRKEQPFSMNATRVGIAHDPLHL